MGRLAEWLDVQERQLAMPIKIAFAVRQCLEEAVANLIDHTPAVAGNHIEIGLYWQGHTLVVEVEDQGPPFDVRAAPAPVRPTSLPTAIPGGWGIHLIRSFANDIGYETVDGRNRLTLRFLPPATTGNAKPEPG